MKAQTILHRQAGVYAIVNTVNGRRYVGSSIKIGKRWADHRRQLRYGAHDSVALQRAWNKYGPSAFRIEVLEAVSGGSSDLLAREQFFINSSESSYNANPIAGKPPSWAGRCRGPHKPETRERISRTKRGVPNPHGTPPLKTRCRICSVEFVATAAVVKSGRRKYCSRRCMGMAAADRMAAIGRARAGTKVPPDLAARRAAASYAVRWAGRR